jgi:hypothetical protein
MVDFASVNAVATSLRMAGSIASTLLSLRDEQQMQSKVLELQQLIVSAQSSAIDIQTSQMELLKQVGSLENRIKELEAWGEEKARYELVQLNRGPMAYVLKQSESHTVAPHALCPQCFDNGRKSIFQSNGKINVHEHTWSCTPCKTAIICGVKDMAYLIAKTRQGVTSA